MQIFLPTQNSAAAELPALQVGKKHHKLFHYFQSVYDTNITSQCISLKRAILMHYPVTQRHFVYHLNGSVDLKKFQKQLQIFPPKLQAAHN